MLAIVHGTLHTVTDGTVEGGTVLVDDEGRIVAVGADVEVPEGVEIVDATGLHVFPGFVDAHTHLGIWEEGVGRAHWDGNEASDPVTPHVRALDAINPRDQGLADARSAGVTTVCVTPGSANAICGQAAVVKTAGDVVDHMVVRQPAGVKMALGENPKSVYKPRDQMPSTRMGTAALIRQALVEAQDYVDKQARAASDDDEDPPDTDLKLESLALVLRREVPARIHAHRADDILTALRLGREFGLDVMVEHCTEGHKVAAELAEAGVPALVGPTLSSRAKVELRELSFATAGALHDAGVTVALISDHPFLPVQYLPLMAGLAVREGLDADVALRALTLTPAELLGVAEHVGSLEPGKDADLALYRGHPFYEVQARCEMALVGGRIVYEGCGG
ncbi:MAG: amidohydrolase [Anaerolineae bacterium]|jgi:imidazolonepropionase-like amidohydrolase